MTAPGKQVPAALDAERGRRTAAADSWLAELLGDTEGVALVAVGGYGRKDLGPGSDLDVLLLYDGRPDIAAVAEQIWYPIWDSGTRLDHAVRTVPEAVAVATDDLKAALGMLYARHVAGADDLTDRLRQHVFSNWRALARRRLPELRELVRERAERHGEVAFLLEPELKEARGGLRDVHALDAIAAAWVASGPGPAVRSAARRLLDVRDALQGGTGRPGARLVAQEQRAVAERLGYSDPDALLHAVSEAGRVIAYASDVTWRSVEGSLRRRLKAPRTPLADGIVEHDGEAVLARGVQPGDDPTLVLRAAAAAAQAGLPLAPPTVELLAANSPKLPVPWPPAARNALVTLLGAGRPALTVFEALDRVGVVTRLLPEWAHVQYRRQRNPLHRFTVDRHLIETAIEAAALTRRVARPDLLLLGALFHDIGKGFSGQPGARGDHAVSGAAVVALLADRIGLSGADRDMVATMVRHHLLLPQTATRRDVDDPATASAVAQAVGSRHVLELLHALAEADARATGPGMWDDWKATLIARLVERVEADFSGAPSMPPASRHSSTPDDELPAPVVELALRAQRDGHLAVLTDGTRITVVAPDQPGLLWRSAGVLALHRLGVRSATATSVGPVAVTLFEVEPAYLGEVDAVRLRDDLRRALDASLDLAARLAQRAATATKRPAAAPAVPPPAAVLLPPGASSSATVIEVRAHDRPGLLFTIAQALAGEGLDVRSARVETLGAEVVDAFYVTAHGHALDPARARAARRAIEAALASPR